MQLELVTPENVRKVCAVKVHPAQDKFVAPVPISLAQAYVNPEIAWPRAITDGDRIVGFVMVAIQPEEENEVFRFCIWRLNINADEQGKGYGRFAIQAVADEARRRGLEKMHVTWVPGDDGPEEFYLRQGFVFTGEMDEDEKIGVLAL